MNSVGAKCWPSVTAAHDFGVSSAFVFLRTTAVEIRVDATGAERQGLGEGLARQPLKTGLGSGFV